MHDLEPIRTFDDIRRLSPEGDEYWMARDLQGPLGYDRWEKFEPVIKKAIKACESAGVDPSNHFHPKVKMVPIGSGAQRPQQDYYLSRYGCYLAAMNGNPRLPQIGAAQTYFAVQTKRQEDADRREEQNAKRLELRDRVRIGNLHLNKAAKAAGVQNYALFHDAGYRGLYEMSLKDIKARKGIEEKGDLLDRADRTELAANDFRITQAEEVLSKTETQGDLAAREIHKQVGREVRRTIEKLGGTMPEDLPVAPHIKTLGSKPKQKKLPMRKPGQT